MLGPLALLHADVLRGQIVEILAKELVIWLVLKFEHQNMAQARVQLFGHQAKELFCAVDDQSFSKDVLKILWAAAVFQQFAPGQVLVVEVVDHDVYQTLNVVAP